MRVTIYKESLNIGLKIPMLPIIVDLLWWYNLCLAWLVSNAQRDIVGFFTLMIHCHMEPRAWVFHHCF